MPRLSYMCQTMVPVFKELLNLLGQTQQVITGRCHNSRDSHKLPLQLPEDVISKVVVLKSVWLTFEIILISDFQTLFQYILIQQNESGTKKNESGKEIDRDGKARCQSHLHDFGPDLVNKEEPVECFKWRNRVVSRWEQGR